MDLHALETFLQFLLELREHVAHEHLHNHLPVLRESPITYIDCEHAEMYGPCMLRGVRTCYVGGHVRQHDIRFPSEAFEELQHGIIICYIPEDRRHAFHGFYRPQIHADDLSGFTDTFL